MEHPLDNRSKGASQDHPTGDGTLIADVRMYALVVTGRLKRWVIRLMSPRETYVTHNHPSVQPNDKLVEGGTRGGIVPEPPHYR